MKRAMAGRRTGWRSIVGFAALALAPACAGGPVDPPVVGAVSSAEKQGRDDDGMQVVAPGKDYKGVSQGEWGARWWEWVMSFPADNNPVGDATGALCADNQGGPAWFLAGTFGGNAERSCTIPEGKALVVPLYNFWNDYPCPDPSFQPAQGQSLQDFLTQGLAGYLDQTSLLRLELDGKAVDNPSAYRATSGLENFKADLSWQALDPCITGDVQQAVSDGYYMIVKPPESGKHTLRIQSASTGGFALDVTYHLKVKG